MNDKHHQQPFKSTQFLQLDTEEEQNLPERQMVESPVFQQAADLAKYRSNDSENT